MSTPEGSTSDGLICAFEVDASGAARSLAWAELDAPASQQAWRWIHLDRGYASATEWLRSRSGLDPLVVEALLAEETRPRCEPGDRGTLLVLRGVNLNPDSEPEDMVSVRLWVENGRVISLRKPRLMAMQALRDAFEADRGPATPGRFLAALASGLAERAGTVILRIDDALDALEESEETTPPAERRARLGGLRSKIIPLRRYMSPQREALQQLSIIKAGWLDDSERAGLREALDRTTRLVEDLDALRERAGLLHDALADRMAERMNRNTYVLSVVAAIFLPLGLITGLLGINVGGIPGTDEPLAFAVVCTLLVVIGVLCWLVLRALKWF